MRYLFSVLILCIASCKNDSGQKSEIRDFSKALRPSLTEIVNRGIVVSFDSSLNSMLTDQDLIRLGRSVHPLLRASAYRAMLIRPSFDHFDVIMNHLSDTAMVNVNHGEFGVYPEMISDDLLFAATWKNQHDKDSTVTEVIVNHNYLKSAYNIVARTASNEKYYASIREMVQRDRLFREIEDALYALARFQKSEDIPLIKNLLLGNSYQMNKTSFRLMSEFPNEAYMEVFKRFFRRQFYNRICRERDLSVVYYSIPALAVYKNHESAMILDTLLRSSCRKACLVPMDDARYEIMRGVWENSCKAYSPLRRSEAMKRYNEKKKKFDEENERYNKENESTMEIPIGEQTVSSTDSAEEKIRWW